MRKKRTLGEYIRQVSNLLEEGKEETARLELKRSLSYYPDHDVLTTLYKQIDADPKVILGDKFTYYTIQPNDTLSTIAQDKLGNGLLFYLLAKYNGIETPRVINVGQHIKIPISLEPSKPVERTPEIAATPPVPTPNPTQGLQAQEAPVEPGQAPHKPVRVAETAPGPMPIPQPEPNRPDTSPAPHKELSAIKDSTTTGRVMPQIGFGQYHALVIGNNNYLHAPKLQAAVSDAQAISALLQKDYGFNVKLLLNATREEVMGSLYDLRGRLAEQDNLLIYYAGHGVQDDKSQEGYWLAINAHKDNPANWISINDITTVLRSMASKHVMVVADSCFSGTLTRAMEPQLPNAPERRDHYLMKMLKKRSRTALTSGGLEPVPDRRPGAEHSVFAHAFMTALRENPDILEGQKLFGKVRNLVVLDAPNTPEYANIRFTGHEGSDFFFARKQ